MHITIDAITKKTEQNKNKFAKKLQGIPIQGSEGRLKKQEIPKKPADQFKRLQLIATK